MTFKNDEFDLLLEGISSIRYARIVVLAGRYLKPVVLTD